jgi:hypothetical protein
MSNTPQVQTPVRNIMSRSEAATIPTTPVVPPVVKTPESTSQASTEVQATQAETVVENATEGQGNTETASLTGIAKAKEIAKRGKANAQAWENLKQQRANDARLLQHTQNELAQSRARIQQAQLFENQLRQDPVAAMKALGVKTDDLYRRAVQEGSPEAALASIQQQLESEKNARVLLENKITQQQQAVAQRAIEADFLKSIDNKKLYPALDSTPKSVLLSAGKQLWQDLYTKTGMNYSNQEILAFLNKQYASHKKSGSNATEDSTTENGSKSPGTGENQSQAQSRTISNRLASSSWTKPANWDSLPDRDQLKLLGQAVKGRLVVRK